MSAERRFASPDGRWGPGRVHRYVAVAFNKRGAAKDWRKACKQDDLLEPYGVQVPTTTPVTCKRCDPNCEGVNNMAKSDWSAAREAAEKSGAIQSDRFKIQEGANRVRILSDFLPHTSYFGTGADRKRRFQWLGYVIDRKDGQIKTFFMPHSIHGMIEAYQKDPDWSFDETPLPYDLTINAKNAGTKDVEYSVVASPKRSGVTAEELALYATKKEIKEVQQAIYEKQNENPPQTARQYEEGGMPA